MEGGPGGLDLTQTKVKANPYRSRKEEAERRKKRDEEEANALLGDFVASFEEQKQQSFVRPGGFPTAAALPARPAAARSQQAPTQFRDDGREYDNVPKKKEKDSFLEELKACVESLPLASLFLLSSSLSN